MTGYVKVNIDEHGDGRYLITGEDGTHCTITALGLLELSTWLLEPENAHIAQEAYREIMALNTRENLITFFEAMRRWHEPSSVRNRP